VNGPIPNALAFYGVWLVTAWGAAGGRPWLGPLAVAAWLSLHLRAFGPAWPGEARLLAAAGLVGYTADSVLVLGGWLGFPPQAVLGAPTTLWMVGLWMGFGATLRSSLAWLRGRYGLTTALGATGGSFAYWGGERLGALTLGEGAILPIGLLWAVAAPGLVWLSERLARPVQEAG
jgi:hypothetical protein